ncbi:MAG: phenylalanine--tRNA ligase subunit alpha [Clostridia bacterium]|nr:phenylalanine--tRNA ligase subunit alpha [Clostridia bacterium]
MEVKLREIQKTATEEILNVKDKKELNDVRVKFMGKQGLLTSILRGMKDLAEEERKTVGALANVVRGEIENNINLKMKMFEAEELERTLNSEKIDISENAVGIEKGALHPVSRVINKLVDICVAMGYEILQGPEVETDYYNFEALNIPKNHPARDMQDSFYISDNILMRTHTSPMQARTMEVRKPPFKIIVPGRVYRNDNDSTHSPVFHQMEGLVVDENISMADLKIQLNIMMQRLFGENIKTRFRPAFFPFTEPSIEVDVSCPNCGGTGCRICKGTGYLEMLGAGIVNPKVLEMSGIDSKKYSGFAFGTGIERPAMVKNSITDMKSLFKNDIRFLKQMK